MSIIEKQLAYGDGAIIVKPCTFGFFAESIIQEIKIEIKMQPISQIEDQYDSSQISKAISASGIKIFEEDHDNEKSNMSNRKLLKDCS